MEAFVLRWPPEGQIRPDPGRGHAGPWMRDNSPVPKVPTSGLTAGSAGRYVGAVVERAWERFAQSPVARLATVTPEGRPHLVPVAFAADADSLWTAVDSKPKSSRSLRRLANIRANPRVSLLVDYYDPDWSALWWVRADGVAKVLEPGSEEEERGIARLTAKYEQYRADPPAGPVVLVEIETWRSWSAGDTNAQAGGVPGL
jgi:PPOX class probable F420-dependent enzyme